MAEHRSRNGKQLVKPTSEITQQAGFATRKVAKATPKRKGDWVRSSNPKVLFLNKMDSLWKRQAVALNTFPVVKKRRQRGTRMREQPIPIMPGDKYRALMKVRKHNTVKWNRDTDLQMRWMLKFEALKAKALRDQLGALDKVAPPTASMSFDRRPEDTLWGAGDSTSYVREDVL